MLKKVAKLVGLVGATAAVVWAMRDRFISVAVSREPEAPHFRDAEPADRGTPIDSVNGIGPVFATRLADAGIKYVSDLAAASIDTVAEAAGVSTGRARSWIEQAQSIS